MQSLLRGLQHLSGGLRVYAVYAELRERCMRIGLRRPNVRPGLRELFELRGGLRVRAMYADLQHGRVHGDLR